MVKITTGTTIKQIGFVLTAGASAAVSGNMIFYLENTSNTTNLKSTTWTTAIATMTQVYNGTYNTPTRLLDSTAKYCQPTGIFAGYVSQHKKCDFWLRNGFQTKIPDQWLLYYTNICVK